MYYTCRRRIIWRQFYDESCKNILANKIILAWIMKSCMKEYKDCSIRDIADHYIEGIPEIAMEKSSDIVWIGAWISKPSG